MAKEGLTIRVGGRGLNSQMSRGELNSTMLFFRHVISVATLLLIIHITVYSKMILENDSPILNLYCIRFLCILADNKFI